MSRTSLSVCVLVLCSCCLQAAEPERSAPILCVYRGASPYGPSNNPAFAAWLGRTAVWGQDSMPTTDWDNIEGQAWLLKPWAEWRRAVAGRQFVLTLVILPGPWDLSGPKRGTDAGKAVSWAAAASGDYNHHFKKLAETLVKSDLSDILLRPGHEFNGGWYAWRAKDHEPEYAEYWRQFVTTMRSVPGAAFKFVFNPNQGYGQCGGEKCWPGDAYVDYVGPDVYDQSWQKDTYPIPEGASEEETLKRQKKVWQELYSGNHGLVFWRDFAKAHNKPYCLPEWGVWKRQDGHGGNDNPFFIEQMHRFIMDPQNNVVWHNYFDYTGGEAHHQLSPNAKGITDLPRSAAKFKELFGAANR